VQHDSGWLLDMRLRIGEDSASGGPRVQAQTGGEIPTRISNAQRCETPLHWAHVASETTRDVEGLVLRFINDVRVMLPS
jgi:hypothetical protein